MNSTTAKIKAVSTEDRLLTVWLTDGRVLGLPLAWYPSLAKATPAARAVWQVSGAGRGIHWPVLDYDLSIAGLLAGQQEHPNALRYTQQTRLAPKNVGKRTALRGSAVRQPKVKT